ncbi:hypothetical protein [Trichocoleus sp. FACHB-262]|uniref:hypothetical protein n=1 Tax=Trichocoleus sp. FACHB-262 TaxID=2692869 RepID=UPI001684DE6F|nr:hypothetical protein [Trichocoleus sp. FACHB-262]MBD2120167.1 hypothetical protein [Trichocoleus sp. FACHB-262]
MQIGRFFSLQQGRVGQYLSSRVLVVRSPFQKLPKSGGPAAACYFGFDKLSKAQAFAKYLSGLGYTYQLRRGKMLSQYTYEIALREHTDLAKVLAYWDRMDVKRPSLSASQANIRDRALQVAPPVLAA